MHYKQFRCAKVSLHALILPRFFGCKDEEMGRKWQVGGVRCFDFCLAFRYKSNQGGRPVDDFRIGSASPYDRLYHDEQRPADSNRKRAKRPRSEVPEDEVLLEQSTAGDSETEDDLGVQDYYTPSDRTEEPE